MARIIKSMNSFRLVIDKGVGKMGPNQREDVGLVQFCLSVLTRGIPGLFNTAPGKFTVPGQGAIKIDGGYGPQTSAYIDVYQALRKGSPSPSLGNLPAPTGQFQGWGGPGGGGWSFGVLEGDASMIVQGALLDALQRDSGAPAWLKSAFFD